MSSKCSRIRKKKRVYCSGDLRDMITIQNRDIVAPLSGVDFTEDFTTNVETPSAVNTVNGKTYFDGVNEETPITHTVGFRFDPTVTSESWILFNGRRLDILRLENLDERSIWHHATCVDRGLDTKAASEL